MWSAVLTAATRRPSPWPAATPNAVGRAAIDIYFSPYDLVTFTDRVPETWKPFMKMLVGDPEAGQDFLRNSPRTYIPNWVCPDAEWCREQNFESRVIEQESRELVRKTARIGKRSGLPHGVPTRAAMC
ncbi:MAG: hypothetical protein H6656_10290 [Ardenticatenaceae bacterium]|nr:hypothetical protein [Ardenticatenaceae bacterium]